MYDLDMRYFDFVEERHAAWQRRQAGELGPWSTDPIIAGRKFTNVYRVLDRGSQLLVRMLYDGGSPKDIFFRCFMYRYTNRPETWLWMRDKLGRWPGMRDLETVGRLLKDLRSTGQPVFSGAYLIIPQPGHRGDKIDHVMDLIRVARRRVARDYLAASGPQDRFEMLRKLYGVGDFLSMQILTDWGYSPYGSDDENDFIMPGPGCRKGIRAWGWTGDYVAGIRHAREFWASERSVLLGDRPPSLMDVQNTFCEFFKYDRYQRKGGEHPAAYVSSYGPPPPLMLPVQWHVTPEPKGTK